MTQKYAIGVDIGGTKIASALITEEGIIHARNEYPTVVTSKDALFEVVNQCINQTIEQGKVGWESIQGIGVGVPGKVDIENGVAVFQNNIPWRNYPLVQKLKEIYGNETKIIIDNDVKMAAYAEYKNHNLTEKDLFTYVTISTGIAATSIENEKIIRGSGFSGEIGFTPIRIDKAYYNLEKVASGPAIEKKGQEIFNNPNLKTKDVFELYIQDDKDAINIVNTAAAYIAQTLYTIICVIDPKLIVMGGSVAYHNPQFVGAIKKELEQFIVDEQSHILNSIYISEYGSDNGVIGAGQMIFG